MSAGRAMTSTANSGTYCLIMKLEKAAEIRVGRLGIGLFPAGYYCYVGSAMRGLEKRVARHFATEKRMHWHVDYFLARARARALGAVAVYSKARLECELSRLLAGEVAAEPMPGFGASDCSCRTHLYYFSNSPTKLVVELLDGAGGGDGAIFMPNRAPKGPGRGHLP